MTHPCLRVAIRPHADRCLLPRSVQAQRRVNFRGSTIQYSKGKDENIISNLYEARYPLSNDRCKRLKGRHYKIGCEENGLRKTLHPQFLHQKPVLSIPQLPFTLSLIRNISSISKPLEGKQAIDKNFLALQDYFHDGSLIAIEHKSNQLMLSLESSEIFDEDLQEPIELSKYHTLKGILHLENIKEMTIDGKPLQSHIPMLGDAGVLLDLKIKDERIAMFIRWENFPPKKKTEECSEIVIDCEKIYWENIPDLFDPFE